MKRTLTSVAICLMLAGLGCGGGGQESVGSTGQFSTNSTGNGPGSVAIQGRVILPNNFPLQTSELRLVNSMGNVTIGSNGNFSLPAGSSDMGIALLTDSGGGLVFMTIAPGGTSNLEIGPTSTAVALLFLALGGPYLENTASEQALLASILADPSLQPLLAQLQTELAANPKALTDGSPALEAALTQARIDFLANVRPRQALNLTPNAEQIRPRLAQFTLTPPGGTLLSGTSLSLDTDSSIVATNTFRRLRTELFVSEIAYTNTEGGRTELSQAELRVGPVSLNGSYAVTSISDLAIGYAGLLFHQDQLAIGSTSVTLPASAFLPDNTPGTQKTHFTVVQLAPYLLANPFREPDFFQDPIYSGQVQIWRDELRALQLQEFAVDVLLPVLNLLAGFKLQEAIGGLNASLSNQAFLSALGNIVTSVPQNAAALVLSGTPSDWRAALVAIYNLIGKGQSVSSFVALAAAVHVENGALTQAIFSKSNAILFALSLSIQATDLGRAGFDLSKDHPGEKWTIDVNQPPDPVANPGKNTYEGTFFLTRENINGGVGALTYAMEAHLVFHNGMIMSPGESSVNVTTSGTLTEGDRVTSLIPQLVVMRPQSTFTHIPNDFAFAGGFNITTAPTEEYMQFEFDSQTAGVQQTVDNGPGSTVRTEPANVFMGTVYGFRFSDSVPLTHIPFDRVRDKILGTTRVSVVDGTRWTLVVPTMQGRPNP